MMPASQSKSEAPAKLRLDGDALVANWRALAAQSKGVACAAAVKADAYGLGARDVTSRLAKAGCHQFFVANWREAEELVDSVPASQIAVLNGCTGAEFFQAQGIGAIPVLTTPAQVTAWKAAGGGRCHVMLDSGINRLGIGPEQVSAALLGGLQIDILMSHLASADEDTAQNATQLETFTEMSQGVECQRKSFCNSAGIMLGNDYHFDLLRPGLSLYGGIARPEMADFIRPVVSIAARVLQIRQARQNDPIGYNATYRCPEDMPVATVALGYADGYRRGFSGTGSAHVDGHVLPVLGRVSMDLVTLDARSVPDLAEGDWVNLDFNLAAASEASGLSQYELLTGLGRRFDRIWD